MKKNEAMKAIANVTTNTGKTDYQKLYKGCTFTYTDTKNADRIGAIRENCRKAECGFKFQPLKVTDFGDKEEKAAYNEAADLYMMSLYKDLKTPARDKALRNVLCALSCTQSEIEEIIKGNLHKTLIRNTLRNRQSMTEEARQQLADINARLELAENGQAYNDGDLVQLSETAQEKTIAAIKAERTKLLTSQSYEKARLCQVSFGTFVKSMELLLGNFLNKNKIVAEYVTLEAAQLNKKWRRWEKRSANAGMSTADFEAFAEKKDFDGLKEAVEKLEEKAKAEAIAEKEAADEK